MRKEIYPNLGEIDSTSHSRISVIPLRRKSNNFHAIGVSKTECTCLRKLKWKPSAVSIYFLRVAKQLFAIINEIKVQKNKESKQETKNGEKPAKNKFHQQYKFQIQPTKVQKHFRFFQFLQQLSFPHALVSTNSCFPH